MNEFLKDFANSNVNLGSWFGIPVKLHVTTLIIFVILGAIHLQAFFVFFGIICIVLLHEIGHCFAARYYNLNVSKILINPLFGLAIITIPKIPKVECVVALAGPFANILLIPLLWFGEMYIPCDFGILQIVNLYGIAFNLLPILPLDGGRALRSFLFHRTNNYEKATLLTLQIGWFTGAILAVPVGMFFGWIIGLFVFVFALLSLQAKTNLQLEKESSPN